jgi:hypothetical protein
MHNDDRFTNPDLGELIQEILADRLALFPDEGTYTVKQLFGRNAWGYLEGGARNHVGCVVSRLAFAGRVPLLHAGERSHNNVYSIRR